ncbi:MAG: diphosphate--fructose-6-phosphate 1-phosphotransferase, partial [Candidatus Margulisiibacteriota bacterium]
MTSPIEEELINTENKHSLLENEVRNLPMLAASIFKKGDQIAPADFKETKISLGNCSLPSFKETFPTLLKEQSAVLDAVKSLGNPIINKRVAVLFSGGPASGGHNVVLGIKAVLGDDNVLYGVKGGPKGLLNGDLFEITNEELNKVKNLGGFDFLGSDRTKIKTKEQFEKVREVVKQYHLNGLIVVGGDDSNTNAAFLAEYLYPDGCAVVGVPKTIDGDLQIGALLPISFGFDTATKIYAELVGNILQDTPSSRKYWHFIKLMGRSASHVALEVALQTKPAITFISEEIEEEKFTLKEIIDKLVRTILERASKGINHGVILVPEGLIEFIPDLKDLIKELDVLFGEDSELDKLDLMQKVDIVRERLKPETAKVFHFLPLEIKKMLGVDRDAHGNLQVSKISTE